MTYGKMGIRDKDHSLPLAVLPVALSATNKTNSRNTRYKCTYISPYSLF